MSKDSDSKFVNTHLDCPSCGHKKCFGINSDGSGYCFSCQTRIPNYEEGLVTKSTTNMETNKIKTIIYENLPNNHKKLLFDYLVEQDLDYKCDSLGNYIL